MGFGIISSYLGKGQYLVEVKHQDWRPEKMVAYYLEIRTELVNTIIPEAEIVAEDLRLDLSRLVGDQQTGLTPLINDWNDAYVYWLSFKDATTDEAKAAEKAVEEAYQKVIEKTEEAAEARMAYVLAQEAVAKAWAEYNDAWYLQRLWEARKTLGFQDYQELWCVDYAGTDLESKQVAYPEIPDGSEVALLDLDLIDGDILIDTAYASGRENKYEAGKHGMIEPIKAQMPNGWMYNLMMYPGAVTWRNLWGPATISNIDYDNDTCSVHRFATWGAIDALPFHMGWDYTRMGKDYDAGQTPIVHDNVPVKYMQCDAAAFEEGDEVVVKFNTAGKPEVVIGFAYGPKPCPIETAIEMYFYNQVALTYTFITLTYTPEDGWVRTNSTTPSSGRNQWRQPSTGFVVSACTVGILQFYNKQDVIFNGTSYGSPVSGDYWKVEHAWVQTNATKDVICLCSYYRYFFDGQQMVTHRKSYAYRRASDPLGASWTLVYSDDTSLDVVDDYVGGRHISDDGSTFIAYGNYRKMTLTIPLDHSASSYVEVLHAGGARTIHTVNEFQEKNPPGDWSMHQAKHTTIQCARANPYTNVNTEFQMTRSFSGSGHGSGNCEEVSPGVWVYAGKGSFSGSAIMSGCPYKMYKDGVYSFSREIEGAWTSPPDPRTVKEKWSLEVYTNWIVPHSFIADCRVHRTIDERAEEDRVSFYVGDTEVFVHRDTLPVAVGESEYINGSTCGSSDPGYYDKDDFGGTINHYRGPQGGIATAYESEILGDEKTGVWVINLNNEGGYPDGLKLSHGGDGDALVPEAMYENRANGYIQLMGFVA